MSVDQAVVEVSSRSERGKGAARRLRRAGMIPGVVYGPGKEPAALAIDPELLRRALKTAHGLNTVLTLKFDGGKTSRLALLKDWETEATTSRLVHADFVEIALDKPVRVNVPLHMVGKCKGVIDGGLLQVTRHQLELDALPANIPTHIDVDITNLGVGHSIHLNDLKLPEGVKTASSTNFSLVSVVAPRAEKEEKPAAAAEAVPGATPAAAAAGDAKAAAPAAGGAAPAKGGAAAKPAAPAAKEAKK